MDNSFFEYLQQLELIAFFSGYPLIYTVVLFIFRKPESKLFPNKVISRLPYGYALVGILYLGLQLKTLYPDYSIENIKQALSSSWLLVWGLLSILFWIPALAKKTVLSLIHSLVFFFILLKDLFSQFFASHGNSIVKNDMSMYTISLILNLGSFALITILSVLIFRKRTSLQL